GELSRTSACFVGSIEFLLGRWRVFSEFTDEFEYVDCNEHVACVHGQATIGDFVVVADTPNGACRIASRTRRRDNSMGGYRSNRLDQKSFDEVVLDLFVR